MFTLMQICASCDGRDFDRYAESLMASIDIKSPHQKVVMNRICFSQFCGLVYMGCPGAGLSLDVWPNPAAGWDAGSTLRLSAWCAAAAERLGWPIYVV
jgi:hypothetical protein